MTQSVHVYTCARHERPLDRKNGNHFAGSSRSKIIHGATYISSGSGDIRDIRELRPVSNAASIRTSVSISFASIAAIQSKPTHSIAPAQRWTTATPWIFARQHPEAATSLGSACNCGWDPSEPAVARSARPSSATTAKTPCRGSGAARTPDLAAPRSRTWFARRAPSHPKIARRFLDSLSSTGRVAGD